MNINWQAVRAYRNIMIRLDRGLDKAEEYDRHFDGGEWSGPFHARYRQTVEEGVAAKVGQRFGITGEEVIDMTWNGCNYELDRFMDVRFKR